MNQMTQFLNNEWGHAIGWMLLNSLWQGILIVFILMIALFFLRKQKAAYRYRAGLAALCLMLSANAITFINYSPESHNITEHTVTADVQPNEGQTMAMTHINPLTNIDHNEGWQSGALLFFDQNMPLLVMIWLIGMLLLSLRFFGELTVIQYLRYRHVRPAAKHWQEQLALFAKKISLHQKIKILESLRIDSPMVIGIFEPVILFPLGMLNNLPPEQVKSVLAHELAHIKRHDYLINLLQSFAEVLFFFNPAVWWLSSYIRTEREHCCDDLAIELTGDEVSFVKSLAQLEISRADYRSLAMGWLGNSPGSVLSRIQRVVQHNRQWQLPYRIFSCIGIICFSFVLFAFSQHDPKSGVFEDLEIEPSTTESTSLPPQNFEEPLAESSSITAAEPIEQSNVAEPILTEQSPEPISMDSVPPAMRQKEEKLHALQQEYHKKMMEYEKKANVYQKQMMEKEQAWRKEEMAFHEKEMELQKKSRALEQQQHEIEYQQRLEEHAHDTKHLEAQEKINELRNAQQLLHDKEAEDPKVNKQIQEIEQQIHIMEREWQKVELDRDKQQLTNEKLEMAREQRMQEMVAAHQKLEYELQLRQHEKELKMLEQLEVAQQLEYEQQLMENELEHQIESLSRQLEMEAEQYEDMEDGGDN